jgi:sulfane dehydrogenase subunit SoxC
VDAAISQNELALAARNHGLPLEALRYPITPVGLHYLLIHYDIPDVDADAWSLGIEGRVRNPLTLSLAELRDRSDHEVTSTMECAGNGRALLAPHVVSQPWLLEAIGTARWRGVRLKELLEEAELLDDAVDVVFTGLDRGLEKGVEQHYQRSLALDDALGDDVLLAYEMNGAPLLPQHGFPLRLLVPGWYGMTSVKWLTRIEVMAQPFEGYQMTAGYRFRLDEDDEGHPVTRIQPRALMVPPGIPDFDTRARIVEAGSCPLQGRAWSGWAPIARVEVSTDGGGTWADAELEPLGSQWAWRGWRFEWNAEEPREYVLCCRASDEAGNAQPDEPIWNVGGYSNNALQRVPVTVQ